MTDRHPDDLYDALRDRLADYGQEPPAPLWANIRAQLPPPVAVPQLRRRRRWSPVLLLGLLLTVVGGSYWLWQRQAATSPLAHRMPPAAGSPALRQNQPKGPTQPGAATDAAAPALPGTAALGNTEARSSAGNIGNTTAGTGAGTTGTAGNAVANVGAAMTSTTAGTKAAPKAVPPAAAVGTYAASAARTAAAFEAKVTSAASGAKSRVQDERAARGRTAAGLLAGRPSAKPYKPVLESGAVSEASALARNARSTQDRKAESSALTFQADASKRASRRAGQPVVAAESPAVRPGLATTSAAGDANGNAAGVKPTEVNSLNAPPATTSAASGSREPAVATAVSPAATAAETAKQLPISPLEAPAVALQLPAFPTYLVRPRPDSAYLPKRLARHWALLVLAGPALTYRRLGSSPALDMAAPSLIPTQPTGNTWSAKNAANQQAQWERQSTGFGAQAQVSRVLNGRWMLSAGLGYQEYASYVTTREVLTNRFMPTPSAFTNRDTYHFLTVPVQAHYAVGSAGGRLRYGLVAGAEPAIYLGGSTLRANGTVDRWNSSNSPYRTLSLALSAGLDIRYRLSPRLEAVAQPTATYFLNSLPQPTADLAPRYLWGGSALLGVSYHLR